MSVTAMFHRRATKPDLDLKFKERSALDVDTVVEPPESIACLKCLS